MMLRCTTVSSLDRGETPKRFLVLDLLNILKDKGEQLQRVFHFIYMRKESLIQRNLHRTNTFRERIYYER